MNYLEGRVNISSKFFLMRKWLLMSYTTCFLGFLGREWECNFEISYYFPQLITWMRTHSCGIWSLPQGMVFGEKFSPHPRRKVCLPSKIMSDNNNYSVKISVSNFCHPFVGLTIVEILLFHFFSVLTYRTTLAISLYSEWVSSS